MDAVLQQDVIRAAVISSAVPLVDRLSEDEKESCALPLVIAAATDCSWRVRSAFLAMFPDFVKSFGPDLSSAHLIPALQRCLADSEPEVRIKAVKAVEASASILPPAQIANAVLPSLSLMGEDPNTTVKGLLAEACCSICVRSDAAEILSGPAEGVILRLIQTLTVDENHEVFLGILKIADKLCQAFSQPHRRQIARDLAKAAKSLQWRIRLGYIKQIPSLVALDAIDMGDTELEVMRSLMKDPVADVRGAGVDAALLLVQRFGADFARSFLLPALGSIYGDGGRYKSCRTPQYLMRITVLRCFPEIAAVLPQDVISEFYDRFLLSAFSDPVVNVRFTAARIAVQLHKSGGLNDRYLQDVKNWLKQMEVDPDVDARYYAAEALRQIG